MTRICTECGSTHNTILEDAHTGAVLEIFDRCRGCLLGFGPMSKIKPQFIEQIVLAEEDAPDSLCALAQKMKELENNLTKD